MYGKLFLESGLSLERLRAFCLVADSGGFTRAAGGNPTKQSQFSHQVQALEDFFGTALFQRRGRDLVLTCEGRDLLQTARLALGSLEDFKQRASMAALQVAIGAGGSIQEYLLNPAIARLMAEGRLVRLDIQNLPSEACIEAVQAYRLDIGIGRPPRTTHGLQIHYILTSPVRAVATEKVARGIRDRASIESLAQLPTILLSGSGSFKTALLDVFSKAGLKPDIRVEVSSLLGVRRFVQAGLGVSYLPAYCLADAKAAGLTSWDVPALSGTSRRIVLYHLKEKNRNRGFRDFVTSIVSEMKRSVG